VTEFDYVIVGAGSAGCVLAARLSANGRHSVLLLEAGPRDSSPWLKLPIGYGKTFNDPKVNWMYQTEPDPGLSNQPMFWPRGKVIGGSGAINAMIYIRGHRGDFDDWASLGNPGWSYDEVLPYFKKTEGHCFGASEYHGGDGPLGVSDFRNDVHPLSHTFLEGCRDAGYRPTEDFNGREMEGFGLWQATIKQGLRSSTATALLHPAMKRANLTVTTSAQVTRILWSDRAASGVEYREHGVLKTVSARREVILSGGAINSPQLLELSGVGNPESLGKLGIPVVHALPAVGEGLQDHVAVCYFYKSKVPTLNNQLRPWWGKVGAAFRYALTRRGPLGMSVNQAGAFVRSRAELARPNLHLYFNPISYTIAQGPRRKLLQPDPWPAFLMSFNTCRPTSRGSVHLRSNDPFEAPVIRTQCLSTPEDIQDVHDGARVLRQLAATPALSSVISSEYLPGPDVISDEAVLADFRARSGTVYHASCTCAMGPDPKTAVVDASLRVHGLGKLRVVDASVFPTVTSGNTNAPTIMVAEKAADLILSA